MKNTSRCGLPLALALVMGGGGIRGRLGGADQEIPRGVVAIERGTQHYEGAVGCG